MAIQNPDLTSTTAKEPLGLTAAVGKAFGRTGVPDSAAKGNYGRPEVIIAEFKKAKTESFDNRQMFERLWWRNLLYYFGRQWITYNRGRGWVDKRMAKWVPRPVTNKIQEATGAILSVFQAVQLGTIVTPNSNDPRDVSTAETADRMVPLCHEEHEMDQVLALHDFWAIVAGSAILHPWWNKNGDGASVFQPFEACAACKTVYPPEKLVGQVQCPSCGAIDFAKMDGTAGRPARGRYINEGRGATDVISPLEWASNPQIANFAELPYGIRLRWRQRAWVEDRAPQTAKQLTWASMPEERSLQLLKTIATQSDVSTFTTFGWGGTDVGEAEGAQEFEWWVKPCTNFPEGLVARFMGDQDILHFEPNEGMPGPLPYDTATGGKLFPFYKTDYEQVGGRFWGRSPLDSAIQLQDQINQIDSLVQLTIQRVANPVWLEPKGAEVKAFTGEPGLVVKYNPQAGGGMAKPERLAGENVPSSLTVIRQQKIDDLETLTGTYDVTKGDKPAGVEAFSAMQLLVERAQSRFTPTLKARGRTYRGWASAALEIERQFGPKSRTQSILRPNRGYTVQEFANADLQGAVTVRIEDGSQVPKTSLGKRAATEQLNQMGLVDANDPDQKYAIYQQFGCSDMIPRLDFMVKSALAEQWEFEEWARTPAASPEAVMQYQMMVQQAQMLAAAAGPGPDGLPQQAPPPPPISPLVVEAWHEDQVHLAEHQKWLSGDAIRELLRQAPHLKPIVTEHYLGQAMSNSNRNSGGTNQPKGTGEGAQKAGPR